MRLAYNMVFLARADSLVTTMAMETIKGNPSPVYMHFSRVGKTTVYKPSQIHQVALR